MKDIKRKYLIIALSIVVIFIFAGTFAYWNWTSSENKNVVFNTSKALKDYITYDDGESKFVGDFQVSDSYLDGVHTTISMKKSDDVANITLMATINMDINAIGETMKVSPALKWVVTSGDSTNVGSILSSGNFVGTNAGDTMVLLPNIEVLETVQQFTIWIWIDSSENPSADLTGETLDTVVWTQIDQVEGVVSTFLITKKSVNYQTINATVVNNMNKIVSYAVTTSNTEPSTWINIDSTDQSNVYNLEYSVSATGKYYIWFKDSLGNVVSDNVTVSEIDTSAPVCTFGEFNPSSVADGETATVDLVCTDNDLKNINLSINDIEITGSSATLSNISKVKTANGYTYTISLMGTDVDGVVSLTLSSGKIFDSMNNTNESVSSGNLTIQNDTTAPKLELVSTNDARKTWAKSQTFSFKLTDSESGLAAGTYTIKYAFVTTSGEVSCDDMTNTTTITVSSAGATSASSASITQNTGTTGYIAWCNATAISDTVGNTRAIGSIKSYDYYMRIDNTGPTISSATVSTEWTNTNKTITVTATDVGVGTISGYYIGTDTTAPTSSSTWQTGNTFSKGAGTYYIWAKDSLGNISSTYKSVTVSNIDTTAPKSELVSTNDARKTWAKSQTFSFKLTDSESGLAAGTYTIKYAFVTTSGEVSCDDMTNTTTITVSSAGATSASSASITQNTGTTGYIAWCNATAISDTVGNTRAIGSIKSYDYYMRIDNTLPAISITSSTNTSYAKTQSFKIKLSDANSGLAAGTYKLKYKLATSSAAVSCDDIDETNTVSLTVSTAGTTSIESSTITLSDVTYYKIHICSVDTISDVAGNTLDNSTVFSDYMKIDNSAPSFQLISDTRTTWSQSQTFSIKIYDNFSGLKAGTYTIKYIFTNSSSGLTCDDMTNSTTITVSSSGTVYSATTANITQSSGSSKYLAFCSVDAVSDNLGNSREANTAFNGYYMRIDNSKPTITLGSNSDSTYEKTKSVTVTIKDAYSGLASGASLKYGWSTTNDTKPSSYTDVIFESNSYTEGTTSGVTFTASGSGLTGSYYLWVEPVTLKDVVGNSNTTTVVSTGTFKFDNTAPSGTISASMSGTTITATVSASDSHSGISEYQYAIDTNSNCSTAGFTSSTSSSYTFSISSFTTYYVCVKLKDNAGNLSSVISTSIADTTPPTAPTTMSFVFGDWSDYTDASWTNKKVYAARSAGQSDVSLRGPSGSTDSESGVAKYQISSDGSTWVDYNYVYTDAMYYMDSEGTHYRYFRACDNAGNCGASLKKTVKIDKTTPTVSYSVAGGTYAPTKSVTVTASDSGGSGFNYMNVHVYKDGSIVSSKSVNSRTTSTYTVSLDSDGAWTIYAQVYDNAGNTQNQSPNNGSGWYYQQYTIYTTKNGAYFVNNRSSISNLSSSLVGGMYRFQGSASAVTNNYICFGTSSKSTCTGSPDYWMYRIIGVTSGGQIKVIKKTPLGGGSGNTYQWHNSNDYALWSGCSLYSNLNGSSFLTNTTYLPSGWSDKISTSNPWYFRSDNVAYGSTYMAYTGADMYTYETGSSSLTAKIGLISLHDYYLAAGDGISCGTSGSCTSSWIQFTQNSSSYATSSEWSMARRGYVSSGYYGIRISSNGYATDSSSLVTTYYIVRPVFYISSSVNITSGSGTSSDPYIIG